MPTWGVMRWASRLCVLDYVILLVMGTYHVILSYPLLQRVFRQRGMLVGSVADYMARQFAGRLPPISPWSGALIDSSDGSDSDDEVDNDVELVPGPRTMTNIWLASQHRKF